MDVSSLPSNGPLGIYRPSTKSLSDSKQKERAEQVLGEFEQLEDYFQSSIARVEKLVGQRPEGNMVKVTNGRLPRQAARMALGVAKSMVSLVTLGTVKFEDDLLDKGKLNGYAVIGEDGGVSQMSVKFSEKDARDGVLFPGRQKIYSMETKDDGTRTYTIVGDGKAEMLVASPLRSPCGPYGTITFSS